MFKFIIALLLSASFAYGEEFPPAKALKDFHKGLEERGLLVRHQVARTIASLESLSSLEEKERVFRNSKTFFGYLLKSVENMDVDSSSKRYMKNQLQDLISMRTKPHQKEQKVAKARPSASRESKFNKPIVVRNNLKEFAPKTKAKISRPSLYSFAGWIFGFMSLGGLFISLLRKGGKRETESGGLKLKMFKDASTPVIFVDERENIYWSNKSAEKSLELTPGSSFFYSQELMEDEEGDVGCYQDEKGYNYLVEKKAVKLGGEKYQMLIFIKSSKVSGAKSYKRVEDSMPIGAGLLNALEKYDYLYGTSSIPVSVDQRAQDMVESEAEKEALDKIVYLAYQMAKDARSAKVNFIVDRAKGRKAVQVDIRGLKADNLDMSQEVYLGQDQSDSLGDLWNELETSLCQQNGRVFMYDNSKDGASTFTIIVSFSSLDVRASERGARLGA